MPSSRIDNDVVSSREGLTLKELGDLVPRPDPTVLTTSQLIREVSALKELIYVQFESRDKSIDTLRGESEARLEEGLRTLHNATELRDEKIRGLYAAQEAFKELVLSRFAQQDTITEKAARDVKSAVDAAFAAAKEAVGEQNKSNALSITKSETAFTKSIDQLGELVKTMGKAIDDKIEVIKKSSDDKVTDIKDRLVSMEGQRGGRNDVGNWLALGISTIFAIVGIASIIFHLGH